MHLFEWRWQDIARECEQVLAPAGYRGVQISPPNEHPYPFQEGLIKQGAWWLRYQPVSYQLESRSGSEIELRDMVARCKAVGVEVYADVVLNHMARQGTKGFAGSEYDAGSKRFPDFNALDFNPECAITGETYQRSDDPAVNLARRNTMRNCELGAVPGLPDLKNRSVKVQEIQASYLQTLVDMGIAGFRVDAAKHMHPEAIRDTFERVKGDYLVFQEVIDRDNEPFSGADYTQFGPITEFRFGEWLGDIFKYRPLVDVQKLTEAPLIASEQAVVFVDNHDTQRGHAGAGVLSHRDGQLYNLGNVFMLAWPYGFPMVMSSYEWGGKDDNLGPPVNADQSTLAVYDSESSQVCNTQWICEHQRGYMVNMVKFRNKMQQRNADSVTRFSALGEDQIAFNLSSNQATEGFVFVSRAVEPWQGQVNTQLPAGQYCNFAVEAVLTDGTDCEELVTVEENGMAHLRMAPQSAIALMAAH